MWRATRDLTPDDIEQELVACESAVSRFRARQAQLLVEAGRRQVPRTDGCRTLSEWAVRRMDVSTETARRLVSTGRRLEQLPYLTKTLAAGEVGFERAEQVSKVATPEDEIDVLDDSRRWDLPGLVRQVGLRRRVSRTTEQQTARDQSLMFRHGPDGSPSQVWGQLPGVDARLVEQKLMAVADTFPPLPDGTRPPLDNRMASALVTRFGRCLP